MLSTVTFFLQDFPPHPYLYQRFFAASIPGRLCKICFYIRFCSKFTVKFMWIERGYSLFVEIKKWFVRLIFL